MDISSLRDRNDAVITVFELNNMIKGIFDSSPILGSMYIKGEISNFTQHRSGHLYFSLKDSECQIRAVMFHSSALKLKFVPENGMQVIVHGSLSVYQRDGTCQIYVKSMQPDGIGGWYLAFEQLRNRLQQEGIFAVEHKKQIPLYPSKIGVITSPSGAAVRDIINVLNRRYPIARIYLYPVLVQGDGAVNDLVKAVNYFSESNLVDTVIIGRGGGSIEDLWAFNDEGLARAIYNCRVPIISGVGHETDFTICDFVCDMRAPTPSAAAEISAPDINDLLMRITYLIDKCEKSLIRISNVSKERVRSLSVRLSLQSPVRKVYDMHEKLAITARELNIRYSSIIAERKHALIGAVKEIETLNPLSVLSRGYCIAEKNSYAVNSVDLIAVGDDLKIRLADGCVDAQVKNINHGD